MVLGITGIIRQFYLVTLPLYLAYCVLLQKSKKQGLHGSMQVNDVATVCCLTPGQRATRAADRNPEPQKL